MIPKPDNTIPKIRFSIFQFHSKYKEGPGIMLYNFRRKLYNSHILEDRYKSDILSTLKAPPRQPAYDYRSPPPFHGSSVLQSSPVVPG